MTFLRCFLVLVLVFSGINFVIAEPLSRASEDFVRNELNNVIEYKIAHPAQTNVFYSGLAIYNRRFKLRRGHGGAPAVLLIKRRRGDEELGLSFEESEEHAWYELHAPLISEVLIGEIITNLVD